MEPQTISWQHRLRQFGWALAFLAALAAMLVPIVIASAQLGHEITVYEQAAILIAATFLLQLLRRKSLWEVTGQPNRNWLREFAIGGAIGAALMLAPALFLFAGGWVSFRMADFSAQPLIGAIVLMMAVAVTEELLFRGVLFQRLIDAVGAWPAQLLIAALFVLTHMGNPGMVGATKLWAGANIFLASILFGYVYLRTRSLAMPIGLHFMANTVQGSLLGFGVSGMGQPRLLEPDLHASATWLTGGAFGLEASAPCLVALALIIVALVKWRMTANPVGQRA